MKTMRHTARMSQPLHVEAPGCIINIRAGLETDEGRPVTVVSIICDDYATDTWRLDDGEKFVSLRIVKQPY